MASYDPYDRDYPRQYVREERREPAPARDRFLDPRDYPKTQSRDLVPRQNSELSVEEIRREFPPPSGRDIRRARSAGPMDDDYGRPRGYGGPGPERYDPRYDRERDRDYDRRHHRGPSNGSYQEEDRSKSKAKSKQEKIIAAVAGAALLVGGKELYDRHEAKEGHTDVHRSPLSSAALAGFGALAGYQGAEFYSKQQAKKDQKTNLLLHRGRDGQMSGYYSDEEGDGKDKKSNKNFLESALAATGLGAAVKQFTGHGDDKSRRGSPTGSRAGSRAGSKERGGGNKIQKAAMASLLAGATEAFRVSREPGGWRGEKAKRVLTAAAGAATVDAAQSGDKGKLGLAESVIGGLVGNRLINGSKRDIEEDEKTGRSRSRSRARSKSGGGGGGSGAGLAALATAGLGAFGAKKVLDRSRSRSRSRRQDSYDSRDPSPERDRRRQRSRSRSVVDRARNSLAKLGIGSAGAGAVAADDHRRRDQDDFDDGHRGSRSRRYSDEYDGRDARDERDDRGYSRAQRGGRERSRSRRRGGRSDYGSDTDLGDSDDDEKRAKKMRGKQLITAGLAGVATIHAAHEVFENLEKRKERQKAVNQGRLSKMEAKKLKSKALVKDATAIGIAAMGIKGAVEELKSAKDLQHECKNFQVEKAKRHEKREQRRKRLEMGPRRRSGSLPEWRKQSSIAWDGGVPHYDGPHYTRRPPAAPPLRHREV